MILDNFWEVIEVIFIFGFFICFREVFSLNYRMGRCERDVDFSFLRGGWILIWLVLKVIEDEIGRYKFFRG